MVFFFQAEDGIRDIGVTGVQTCALPIWFQYGLGFDEGPVDDDVTLEQHGVSIVIDPYSAPYLKGATIDFLNGLEESGFKIDNPNAAASCGCGHSFTVADDAPGGAAHGGGCGSGCSH